MAVKRRLINSFIRSWYTQDDIRFIVHYSHLIPYKRHQLKVFYMTDCVRDLRKPDENTFSFISVCFERNVIGLCKCPFQ
jgi:hypothetical protein